MPTALNYPATLPLFLRDPYKVRPRPAAIERDWGMMIRRRRIYSDKLELIDFVVLLNSGQEPDFRTFYDDTLEMGTLWFNCPILANGQITNHEVMFVGDPPDFVPANKYGYVRSTGTLLSRRGLSVLYELTDTQAVNIDALATKPSNDLSTPGGVIVTISTNITDQVIVRKPSIASDPALTWDAWSQWASDGADPPGDGLTWFNRIHISDQDDALIAVAGSSIRHVSIADAWAAAQNFFPVVYTGHTAYKFWDGGFPVADNRGGLSFRVDVYSLVVP